MTDESISHKNGYIFVCYNNYFGLEFWRISTRWYISWLAHQIGGGCTLLRPAPARQQHAQCLCRSSQAVGAHHLQAHTGPIQARSRAQGHSRQPQGCARPASVLAPPWSRAQGPAGHASDHGQFLHFTLGFWPSQPYVLESIFKFRYLSRPKRRHYLQGDPLAIPSPNLTTRSSHRNRHTYSYRNVLTQAVCFKAGSKYWSILLNLV